jgi:hypothetical protein
VNSWRNWMDIKLPITNPYSRNYTLKLSDFSQMLFLYRAAWVSSSHQRLILQVKGYVSNEKLDFRLQSLRLECIQNPASGGRKLVS